jgi:hypothetical protein
VVVGLEAPRLESGAGIDGSNKRQHRREQRTRRIKQLELQQEAIFWLEHDGNFEYRKRGKH